MLHYVEDKPYFKITEFSSIVDFIGICSHPCGLAFDLGETWGYY